MQNSNHKITHSLTLLLLAVVGVALLFLLDHTYRSDAARKSERELAEVASAMQRPLSMAVNNLILAAEDLRAFLLTQPDPPVSHAFADFAATLRDHYPALKALMFVGTDRTIREIFPLAGNERAVSLDLNKRLTRAYVEKAIRERQLIVGPPHTMSNGRLAVIARSPMFRGEKFVGLAQAILHVPDVVQSELGSLGSEFAIQLRDENGKLFWGEERLEGPTQSRQVAVGHGSWTLSVASAEAPTGAASVLALIWGIGGLVLLSILASVRRNYRLHLALKDEVAETTRELRLHNEELERQIRQRLEGEMKVRRSEQRLREAQQIARLGNWEWDIVNDRVYWSDELYRIFGLNPQEFEPTLESFYARIHPQDRDTIRQQLAETLEHGAPYGPEHRIILPNGEIRYLRCAGKLEGDSEGKPQRMAGTAQDVTEQKLALKALEESERNYRAVLENASDGIIIASLEGKVLDGNRRMQTLLGYSREELLNLNVNQIHPPEEADSLRTAFNNIRERGYSLMEHLLVRRDGTTTPVEVAGTLITFDSRQVALGVFRDISERKRIEAELHQHRENLEQLVEQRTAELVALNGELEAFSYSVSHDLRAPLRAINGFSSALREDCGPQLDATGRSYLDRIQSATQRMGRLIDDLLHLSRMIRAEMHVEAVSLSAVASEILLELNAAEPEREGRFVVEKGITAQGDPILIRSLLENLLSNAWKFTRTRAEAVIEFGAATREGKPLYFVRDNGIGFEMTHSQELFKPFHRLHRTADYEGSGIGLATAQRIVHRHGGRIWAESEPEHGAIFYFTLGTE